MLPIYFRAPIMAAEIVGTDLCDAGSHLQRARSGCEISKHHPEPSKKRCGPTGHPSPTYQQRFLLFHSFTFLPFTIAFLPFSNLYYLFPHLLLSPRGHGPTWRAGCGRGRAAFREPYNKIICQEWCYLHDFQ